MVEARGARGGGTSEKREEASEGCRGTGNAPSRTRRANDLKTQTSTSGRVMRERKQVNYDERAFDRKLAEAIEERPTRHARFERRDYEGTIFGFDDDNRGASNGRGHARFERRDYEGSHYSTRKPGELRRRCLEPGARRGHRGRGRPRKGTNPRVRDPDASKDASEESAGAGGEEDDGLGTDSSEDEETYWQRWERNRAASAQKALARQTGVRIESPAPSPIKLSEQRRLRPTRLRDRRESTESGEQAQDVQKGAAVLSQSSESSDENDDDDDESDYEEELGIVVAGGGGERGRRRHVSISILTDRLPIPPPGDGFWPRVPNSTRRR